MTEHVLMVERDPRGVVRVALNRPEARNALSPELTERLIDTFTQLGNDKDVRVIVLSGEGGAFCAGGDLASLQQTVRDSHQQAYEDGQRFDTMFRAIDECRCPVVARVDGPALGGGAGLAACADIVVASESAVFGCPEARVGIIPAIIAPYVMAKVGVSTARRLMLTGERISAGAAREAGLVHHVVPAEELDSTVDATVDALLACDPAAQRAIKRLLPLVTAAAGRDARSALTTLETARVRVSEDGQRGLASVLAHMSRGHQATTD